MSETSPITAALSPEQRNVAADAPRLRLLAAIHGVLDAERVRQAVENVLHAHGVLRAAIRSVPGYRGLRMEYLDAAPPLAWQVADLRAAEDGALDAWLQAFHGQALAVEQGAVLSAALLRTDENRHLLALSVHPLVADRESLQTLWTQIAEAYCAPGQRAPEDVFQYADFVEWRQDLLASEDAAAGRAYWQRLADDAAALPAPRLRGRLDAAPAQVGRISASGTVDAVLAALVMARAQALGTTPETLLQAVWWLLLSRLEGATRLVGGWQHDCRRDYEPMQGAVGLFDKVLPVLVDVGSEESLASWTGRLHATLQAHVEMQEYWPVDAPLLSAHTNLGFSVHQAVPALEGEPLWQPPGLPGPMPCFELAMQITWQVQGAQLSVHAEVARHSKVALAHLLLQFNTLLEAGLAQPEAPVGSLALVGPQERERLLTASTPVLAVGMQTIAERIAHWAQQTPEAPALEAGTQRLSYRELDQRINRLAHWLVAQGVTLGSIVALQLPRSIALPVAMFAAWRVGAAYLPLEPAWPEARRAAVLADAQPALVLDAATYPELEGGDPTAPTHRIASQDLAYVLYTSGSTGLPKGVAIEQGQLLNYVSAASAAMRLETCRRWALTSSVVADLGNTALFGAFFHGACLVVAQEDEAKDAHAFARFMADHAIDALKIVPSHLEALLECEAPRLPGTLVLGGEAASGALVERIQRLAPQCAIYNHYGPTETTVGVMVHAVPSVGQPPAQLPLTQVLGNNRVHVLDAALGLVPAGGQGEVYVGGNQLCRGYLNRAVGDAFVDDPFRPGERLYRTGDLAQVLAEGGIRLAGRSDHQVKVQGFRVEPAEVEAVLLAQTGVRQAVVLAAPDASGSMQLRAFLVADAALSDGRALRESLTALLPAHMVPASLTVVPSFARLPNGKIDRLALQSLLPATVAGKALVAPRSALEAVLADGMAAQLGKAAISVDDDFFELGGHSLQVIKFVARLRKQLQVEVAAGLVFDHPTPAALAAKLGEDEAQLEQRAQALRQAEDTQEETV